MYKDIKNVAIIQKCHNHRHNRSAHNICHTGHIVQPKDILNSDIKIILDDILADIMCYHNK